jgi:hypothetical protein
VEGHGKKLSQVAKEKGMEGIVAKRKDSIYQPGKRTSDWLEDQSAGSSKNSSSEDLAKVKAAGKIWAPCY